MAGDSGTTLERLLDVEQLEVDLFRGASPPTLLQQLFGGQVAGQALVAATRTVEPALSVHSLHGYFLRPGQPEQPVVYRVERVRDGRSFVTRRVTGIQSGKAIFTMASSFQVPEEGLEHQDPMPGVPEPDDLGAVPPERAELVELHRLEWPGWDLRDVEPTFREPGGSAARQQLWMRYREPLPELPVLHVCALAYASDLRLLGTSLVPHPGVRVQAASLDHAMWFLRPFRADDWLLYDQTSPAAVGGRGLTHGRIFDRAGSLVATVVQEVLIRPRR
jgi:acyl-CoA thioesterase-2